VFAEELRHTARRLRLPARQTRSPDARTELVNLAERFERMASQIDPGDASGKND
jgi:hypothetical protein